MKKLSKDDTNLKKSAIDIMELKDTSVYLYAAAVTEAFNNNCDVAITILDVIRRLEHSVPFIDNWYDKIYGIQLELMFEKFKEVSKTLKAYNSTFDRDGQIIMLAHIILAMNSHDYKRAIYFLNSVPVPEEEFKEMFEVFTRHCNQLLEVATDS